MAPITITIAVDGSLLHCIQLAQDRLGVPQSLRSALVRRAVSYYTERIQGLSKDEAETELTVIKRTRKRVNPDGSRYVPDGISRV